MKLTSSTRGECTITGRAATLDSAALEVASEIEAAWAQRPDNDTA